VSARSLVRRAAAVADRLLPTPEGLVVLIYHRVGGGSDSAVDLPVATFRTQMEWLAERHAVLPLATAVDALRRGERPTGVVITFDDGAADFCDHAVPVMRDLQLPSTLYLVTSAPDAGELPWGVPAVSWSALRDAAADGLVDVQSHTHRHTLLHHTPPPRPPTSWTGRSPPSLTSWATPPLTSPTRRQCPAIVRRALPSPHGSRVQPWPGTG
jgi:peptidoglycan/xylan/chitin deacetylase (PgdA/CDA1 family)